MNHNHNVISEMSNQPAFSASYFKLLFQVSKEEGWNQEQLLKHLNIDIDQLSDTEYLSHADIYKLIENYKLQADQPSAGFALGQRLLLSSHSALNPTFSDTPTGIKGLLTLQRFLKLRTNIVTLDINIKEDCIDVYFDCDQYTGHTKRFILEVSMGATWSLLHHWCNTNALVSAHLACSQPENAQNVESCLSAPVYYQCERDLLKLRLSTMTEPAGATSDQASDATNDQCMKLLGKLQQGMNLTQKVKHLLSYQPEHFFNQNNLAAQLGLSTRSLRRRLRENNTSYQQLLDEVRCELAQRFLLANSRSINEVAKLLGYTEPTNFTRAFRRWTGETPAQVRAKYLRAKTGC